MVGVIDSETQPAKMHDVICFEMQQRNNTYTLEGASFEMQHAKCV